MPKMNGHANILTFSKINMYMKNINFLKKLTILFVLILFIFSNLYSQSKPKLRWAADAESGAPYVFRDPVNVDSIIGFEVDIIYALAKELNMEPEFVSNQWSSLVPSLQRGDYDIAINGLEITQDRTKVINFSIPYYITFEQIVVRKSQNDIKTLSDLVGKKAGTLGNSYAERLLKATEGIVVRPYDSEVGSFEDLKNKRLEGVLIDYPVALYYITGNPDFVLNLKLTGQMIGEVPYGIAVRKSDTVLLKNINKALEKIARSGMLQKILESWNLWNSMIDAFLDSNYVLKDSIYKHVAPVNYVKFLNDQGIKASIEQFPVDNTTKPVPPPKQVNPPGTDYSKLFERYIKIMPNLGEAALITLGLSLSAMFIAILVGLILALLRIYAPSPLSRLAILYIEIVRGTPLLIQLYLIYFAFPNVPYIGFPINPFAAAVIGLGLNYAAYEAENYRAGIFSVHKGQMEAAISLGMTRNQALIHVILPQAIRLVIPPMTNDFISLLKDSSIVSIIAMVELTKIYYQLASTYYDFLGIGIIVATIYLLLGLPFVKLAKIAEIHFAVDKRNRQE